MQTAIAKQNEVIARYKKARVLIIEDSAEARGMLRGMLRDAGFVQIDLAASGQEGVDYLSARQYNLVLCDYNLGKGKDGQQVLEEARYSKCLGSSTVFIMITAETTVEMVMGALEYQPDSYLSKPYTRVELMSRVSRAFDVKSEYHDIEKAFGSADFEQTVTLCDKKMLGLKEPPMRALRLKGEALLSLQQYAKAKSLYQEMLSQREVSWAAVGLGKALIQLEDYAPAATLFSKLIESQPNIVESYDWLAKIQLAQEKPRVAQETLEMAIDRSPKAVLRQMQLAKIALMNRSYLVAEKAYRRAIMLSSNSCYKTPANYLQYVRTLLVKIDRAPSQVCKDAFAEAETFLKRLKKEYQGDAAVQFRANLLECLVFFNKGKIDESAKIRQIAVGQFCNLPSKQAMALSDEYVSSLALSGGIEVCERYIEQLSSDPSNEALVKRLKQRVRGAEQRIKHEQLNIEAMQLHQKGQIMDAHARFSKAASARGASANILLNAVGVCLELAEREDLNKDDWKRECSAYLERLTVLDRCDHRFEAFNMYKARYQAL